jgi:hypothetical protein
VQQNFEIGDPFDEIAEIQSSRNKSEFYHSHSMSGRATSRESELNRPIDMMTYDEGKLYANIEKLMEDSKYFMLGSIKNTFLIQDPIFFRDCPKPAVEYKKIKRCLSCKFEFKSPKEMSFCTFCGNSACLNCCKKTRLYPESIKDQKTGRPTARGAICKLCDRKFFIRELVNETLTQIER